MEEEEFLKKAMDEIRKLKDELEELRFLKDAADRIRNLKEELLKEKYD